MRLSTGRITIRTVLLIGVGICTALILWTIKRRALRAEAAEQGISMAELLRRLIQRHLEEGRSISPVPRELYLKLAALGASGRTDVSEQHDAYLAEALGREHSR
ncbi:MAG: hypothetical protein ACT4PY_14775 [Armatimonadota bacterium]